MVMITEDHKLSPLSLGLGNPICKQPSANLQNRRMSISYFLGLGILNGTGTAIYAARIPERWYPKAFDLYGASHQIMHVLVICGALSHGTGLVRALDYWHSLLTREGRVCPSI